MIAPNHISKHGLCSQGSFICLITLTATVHILGQQVPTRPPDIPWANIVFADPSDKELLLSQVNGTNDFEDCLRLKAHGNLPRTLVQATVSPSTQLAICDSWWIKLNRLGEDTPWQHNTTNHKLRFAPRSQSVTDLELCVRAKNVNAHFNSLFPSKEPASVAIVTMTIMPDI